MAESSVSTWAAEGGAETDSGVFKFAEIDQVDSKFNSNGNLLQNETAYIIVQHDPEIKVTRIVPSTGSIGGISSPALVTRAQSERNDFHSDSNTYDLKFIPTGTVDGLWFLDPPIAKAFNEGGTPDKTISGRKVTVDIDGFGGIPCPALIEYSAVFKQYSYYPPSTSFADSSEVWDVAFTVFYEEV